MYSDAREEASLVLNRDPSNGAAYQLLGVSLAAQHKPEEALKAFERAVELRPDDASVHVDIGLAEVNLKHYDLAEEHLRKAIEVNPHEVNAYTNLASLYRLQGQLEDGAITLHLGVTNNPEAANLYTTWADFLFSMQKVAEADSALGQLRSRQAKSPAVALLIGDFYFVRQQMDKAIAEYRRGLQLDGKNLEIQNHMVDCYLSAGRLKEAAEANEAVRRRAPKDVYAGIAHGRILLGEGKRAEAITELQRVVSQARDSAEAHYFLGLAYWQNRNLPQAKTELLDAVRLAPGLSRASFSLAELHLAAGEVADAKILAERLVQGDPRFAAGHLLLGRVYLQQKTPAKAREQFVEARNLAPGAVEITTFMAQAYVDEKKWAEAENELEAVLKQQPQEVSALESLAAVWTARGQRAKAIARAESYVAQNPAVASGHLVLGKLYTEDSRFDAAQAELSRALQLDGRLVKAHSLLGFVYQRQGRRSSALQEFERAIQAQPHEPYLHTVAADLYREENNRDLARKHYEQALAADPNFVLAMNNLAWMYASDGDNLDVALSLAQKAKQLQPASPNATDTLGWIHYKKGLYASAIPLLEECVAKDSQSSVYQYHLGMALFAKGEKQNGRQHLESALRLKLKEPDAQEARRILGIGDTASRH
jgi:tetratricopeptide (TPR) repeat protein